MIKKLREELGKINTAKMKSSEGFEYQGEIYPAKLLKRFVNTFKPTEAVEVWQENGKLCFKWKNGRAHFNPMVESK